MDFFLRTDLYAGISRGTNNAKLNGVAVGWIPWSATPVRGSVVSMPSTPTTAGPTNGVEVAGASSTSAYEWLTAPMDRDFTFNTAANIIFNIRAFENSMSANVAINIAVDKVAATDGALTNILTSTRAIELQLAEAAENHFNFPLAVAMKKGDRIRIRVFGDDVGTMATGFTFSVAFNGATAFASGDTYVTIDDVLGVITAAPAGTVLYLTDTAGPAVGAQLEKEMWTARGAGVATSVTNTTAGYAAPIQATDVAAGTVVEWYTKPLAAFTLADLVRLSIRAKIDSAASVGMRAELAVCNGDGSGAVVWGSAGYCQLSGANPGLILSAEGTYSWDLSGADTAVADGKRLRLRLFIDDPPNTAMSAGRQISIFYAGAAGATGDSFITLSQTVAASGPTNQNVSVTGLGSAQSFGSITTAKGGVTRTVTGLASAQSFGTVTPRQVTTVVVTGLGSAQSFGTLRFLLARPVGAVSSAQAFGVPTILKGPVTSSVTGLSSAQSFGALTILSPITRAVTGLSSAQAFGTPTATAASGTTNVSVSGLTSAASFGSITTKLWKSVTGLASAQSFGALTFRVTAPIGAVSSAQAFGTPTTKLWKSVVGLGSAQAFGTPTIRATISRSVTGLGSAQSFGTLTFRLWKPVSAVSSAQAFGVVTTLAGPTSRSVTGLGSAQSFGSITTLKGPVTVQVKGLWPSLFVPTIVNQFLVGDGHRVGGSEAGQFGTPTITFITPPTTPAGLGSAQAFGAVTIRATISRSVTGLGSAQSFGTLTFKLTKAVGAVSSAQSFGVLSFKLFRPVVGLGSAQSFGAVTIQTTGSAGVTGLGSAQSFGTLTFRLSKAVGAVSSAQSFGVLAFRLWKPVAGLSSAQAFGVVSTTIGGGPQTKVVVGLSSAQSFGAITIRTGQTVSVLGILPGGAAILNTFLCAQRKVGGALFGTPTMRAGAVSRSVLGLGSAQSFGLVVVVVNQRVTVVGLGSAARLGVVRALLTWLHDAPCGDLDLLPSLPENVELDESDCTGSELAAICGSPLSGQTVCAGMPLITAAACGDLLAAPSASESLDLLQPVGCN